MKKFGRPKIPAGERKKLLQVFIKTKSFKAAKKEIKQIADKYNA